MKVDGVSPQYVRRLEGHGKVHEVHQDEDRTKSAEVEKPRGRNEKKAEGHMPPGVLKHLQEGHHKGVAELRLMINFFDRLQSLESSKVQEAAEEGVETLSELAEGKIEALKTSGLLDEQQMEGLDSLAGDFMKRLDELAESGGRPSDLTQALGDAFAEFDGALRELLIHPPAEETGGFLPVTEEPVAVQSTTDSAEISDQPVTAPVAVEAPAVESVAEEPVAVAETQTPQPVVITQGEPSLSSPSLSSLLDDFKAAFTDGLSSLDTNLQSYSLVPRFLEPSSEGRAYEKFLNIYKQMAGMTSVAAPPEETGQTS